MKIEELAQAAAGVQALDLGDQCRRDGQGMPAAAAVDRHGEPGARGLAAPQQLDDRPGTQRRQVAGTGQQRRPAVRQGAGAAEGRQPREDRREHAALRSRVERDSQLARSGGDRCGDRGGTPGAHLGVVRGRDDDNRRHPGSPQGADD